MVVGDNTFNPLKNMIYHSQVAISCATKSVSYIRLHRAFIENLLFFLRIEVNIRINV